MQIDKVMNMRSIEPFYYQSLLSYESLPWNIFTVFNLSNISLKNKRFQSLKQYFVKKREIPVSNKDQKRQFRVQWLKNI